MMTYCKNQRCEIANKVLQSFAKDTTLRICPTGYIIVAWSYFDKRVEKRWMTRGQDFYPVWYRDWGHGGTAATALAQLVRWIQGKPVLPLSTWTYWAGERVNLIKDKSAIELLELYEYPKEANCVLCNCTIDRFFDWWHLNGVSGPCCSMNNGCKQKGA